MVSIEKSRILLWDLWKQLSDEQIIMLEQLSRRIARYVIRHRRKKLRENADKSRNKRH